MNYKYEDFLHDYDGEEDYFGREDELAFVYTLDKAYSGDVEYMRVLGDIYSSRGYGVKTDYGKAIFWYGKAGDCGDNNSVVRLADLLSRCDKVPKDYERAFLLYELAAEEGGELAAARLGAMYYYGYGCERDVDEARKWLKIGAESGEREACYLYAHILKDEGADGWKNFLFKSASQSYGKAAWELACELLADENADKKLVKMYLNIAAYDEENLGVDERARAQHMLEKYFK